MKGLQTFILYFLAGAGLTAMYGFIIALAMTTGGGETGAANLSGLVTIIIIYFARRQAVKKHQKG